MRILHVHKYFYKRAGAEAYMLSLMDEQKRQGHCVAPFSMHYKKNLPTPWSEFFVSNVDTEGRGKSSPIKQVARAFWSREAYKKMRKMIRAFRPDIVHIHNIYTHLSPSILYACKKEGIPVFMSVHDYALVSANYSLWDHGHVMDIEHINFWTTVKSRYIKGSFLKTMILEVVYTFHRFFGFYKKWVDVFHVPSSFVGDLLKKYGFPQKKVKYLLPGIDIPLSETVYQKKKEVIFAGRLEDYKGVQILILAMKQFPHIKLKILGIGQHEKELKKLARGMKNIEFIGFVKGKRLTRYLGQALIGVIPSIWYEPFAFIRLETMLAGTAVIVSDRVGAKEVVRPGIDGDIFKAGNVEDLVEKMRPFLDDSSFAQKAGKSAKKRASQIGDMQAHTKEIEKEYRKLLQD